LYQDCQIFWVQHTKTGKNIPKLPDGYKKDKMAIKIANIFIARYSKIDPNKDF
jgi:hypothetical protein